MNTPHLDEILPLSSTLPLFQCDKRSAVPRRTHPMWDVRGVVFIMGWLF